METVISKLCKKPLFMAIIKPMVIYVNLFISGVLEIIALIPQLVKNMPAMLETMV